MYEVVWSSKIMNKSDVVLKITSCRSAFFALILLDGHYDILCTGTALSFGARNSAEEVVPLLYDAWISGGPLLPSGSPLPAQLAHLYSFKAWHNIVREVLLPLSPSTFLFFIRLVDGAAHFAVVLSVLPSQTARNKRKRGKKKREFLNRGADRISLWIASHG